VKRTIVRVLAKYRTREAFHNPRERENEEVQTADVLVRWVKGPNGGSGKFYAALAQGETETAYLNPSQSDHRDVVANVLCTTE
jgi:uncharacterized protein with PhoU and TrkA domain